MNYETMSIEELDGLKSKYNQERRELKMRLREIEKILNRKRVHQAMEAKVGSMTLDEQNVLSQVLAAKGIKPEGQMGTVGNIG